MPETKVGYLCFTVLPTTQAHGLQISKMSEAFAQAGAQVDLVHQRIMNNPYGRWDDLECYYNIGHERLRRPSASPA